MISLNTEEERALATRHVMRQEDANIILQLLGLIEAEPDSKARRDWCDVHQRDKERRANNQGWRCYVCLKEKRDARNAAERAARSPKVVRGNMCPTHGVERVLYGVGKNAGRRCPQCKRDYQRASYAKRKMVSA